VTFQTWNLKPTGTLTLEDVIEIFEKRGVNPVSGYDLDESALILTNLYNGRESIFDFLAKNVNTLISNETIDYGPTGFVLHLSKHFYIRIVAWTPTYFQGTDYSKLTSNIIHDHNFCFLTLGLLGPGYETQIWQYPEKLTKKLPVNSHVKVNYEGSHILESGKVFFFDKNLDIHRQMRPKELSLSFNVIERTNTTDIQYDFLEPQDGSNDYLINRAKIITTLTDSLKNNTSDSLLSH